MLLSVAPPSLFCVLTPSSHCLCMCLTCSCCRACTTRFVQVSAVKATLVGPLSWSLWLWGSPLREPRGGCHYTQCQWDRHNGLALSIAWAQDWDWHQHLIHSTPVSAALPCPAPKQSKCNTTPGSSSAQLGWAVANPCCQMTWTSPLHLKSPSSSSVRVARSSVSATEYHNLSLLPNMCSLRGVDNHY